MCDLNDAFELSQPTISHHLKQLHAAGLIDREKRGVWVFYRLNETALADLGALLGGTARVTVARRAAAELLGTAFLVMAVIGSGIAATRLSPGDVGLQLLENSIVTGAALVALILALQPVSAAFNPVVTLVERALGLVDTPTAAALVAAQVRRRLPRRGGREPDVRPRRRSRSRRPSAAAAAYWLAEVVATFGLLLVIFGTLRSGRTEAVAFAVGGYISAAYFFTSSTSFANPAVTVARMLSDTFAGIAPASVLPFVADAGARRRPGRGRGAPALPDHQKGHRA